jgi:hypothetical protein
MCVEGTIARSPAKPPGSGHAAIVARTVSSASTTASNPTKSVDAPAASTACRLLQRSVENV